ncbi:hypothetical protein MXB_2498 [Myxobolus squamalis]|nr:hypothetical protein MXB_2498 [Myxobolus squamalis]
MYRNNRFRTGPNFVNQARICRYKNSWVLFPLETSHPK